MTLQDKFHIQTSRSARKVNLPCLFCFVTVILSPLGFRQWVTTSPKIVYEIWKMNNQEWHLLCTRVEESDAKKTAATDAELDNW